jgi:hypothetical protein
MGEKCAVGRLFSLGHWDYFPRYNSHSNYIINLDQQFYVFNLYNKYIEKFEDTKGVIRSCKSTDNTMSKRKRSKRQTMIYKNITQKTRDRARVNSIAPEG